jgi:hypothetical protein
MSQLRRRAGCIQGDECCTLVAPKMQDGEARKSLSVLVGLVKRVDYQISFTPSWMMRLPPLNW